MVTSSAKLREIAAAQDTGSTAKEALFDAIGDYSKFKLFHALVLVATYVAPERTKGGIIRPDRTLAEDRFQGKIGLVLDVGPRAFVDDNVNKFGGITVQPGDWVLYRAADGFEMFFVDKNGLDGTPCRLLEDVNIKGRVADPAFIY